jgi:hypothetical protein
MNYPMLLCLVDANTSLTVAPSFRSRFEDLTVGVRDLDDAKTFRNNLVDSLEHDNERNGKRKREI